MHYIKSVHFIPTHTHINMNTMYVCVTHSTNLTAIKRLWNRMSRGQKSGVWIEFNLGIITERRTLNKLKK